MKAVLIKHLKKEKSISYRTMPLDVTLKLQTQPLQPWTKEKMIRNQLWCLSNVIKATLAR